MQWGARTTRCPHCSACGAAGILGLVTPGVPAPRRAILGAPSLSPSLGPGSREAHLTTAASTGSFPGARPLPVPDSSPVQRDGFNNVAFWGLNHCSPGGRRADSLPRGASRQPSHLEDNLLLWVVLGVFKSRGLSLDFLSAQGSRGQEGGGLEAPRPHLTAGGASPDLSVGSAGFPGLSWTRRAAAATHCCRQSPLFPGRPRPGAPAQELRPGRHVLAVACVVATPLPQFLCWPSNSPLALKPWARLQIQ